jgi:hypothetical protein
VNTVKATRTRFIARWYNNGEVEEADRLGKRVARLSLKGAAVL